MTETDKDNHHTKKRNAAASGLSAFLPQFFFAIFLPQFFFAIFLPQYFCRNIFAIVNRIWGFESQNKNKLL